MAKDLVTCRIEHPSGPNKRNFDHGLPDLFPKPNDQHSLSAMCPYGLGVSTHHPPKSCERDSQRLASCSLLLGGPLWLGRGHPFDNPPFPPLATDRLLRRGVRPKAERSESSENSTWWFWNSLCHYWIGVHIFIHVCIYIYICICYPPMDVPFCCLKAILEMECSFVLLVGMPHAT